MPQHNRPISGMELARYSGLATFMRLPHVPIDRSGDLDIGLAGLPWDGGTTTRNGSRYGPRQIREMSTLLRSVHPSFRFDPYELANCADVGDAPTNPVDPAWTLKSLQAFVARMVSNGTVPLCFGGDHLVSLPALRALAKERPLGMVHFDAHTDMYDSYYEDSRFTHGTPFRRAIEEGLLDPKRVVQIGIRGTMFAADEYEWCFSKGVTHIGMEELRASSFDAVATKIRERAAGTANAPVYLSLDIDAIDPSSAPGTGVPEIAGIEPFEVQQILRRLRGLDFLGADLVEVSPPIDPTGNTALVAANIGFEMLCLLADALVERRKQ